MAARLPLARKRLIGMADRSRDGVARGLLSRDVSTEVDRLRNDSGGDVNHGSHHLEER